MDILTQPGPTKANIQGCRQRLECYLLALGYQSP